MLQCFQGINHFYKEAARYMFFKVLDISQKDICTKKIQMSFESLETQVTLDSVNIYTLHITTIVSGSPVVFRFCFSQAALFAILQQSEISRIVEKIKVR